MNELILNLSYYKPNENISAEENFTTETFVYILKFSQINNTKLLKSFLAFFLNLDEQIDKYSDIMIDTQRPFSTKDKTLAYPDITIEFKERLLVLIEVKINSSINIYETENGEIINQLQKYDRIIYNLDKKIFLLNKSKSTINSNQFQWFQIYSFLEKYYSDNPVEKFLINNFMFYLKEKNMSIPKVSYELMKGIESLNNLIEQLKIALADYSATPSFGQRWLGFLILEKKLWVGTVYDGENLNITIHDKSINKAIKDSKYKDEFYYEGQTAYCLYNFEENYYFCLSPEKQIEKMKEWIDKKLSIILSFDK
jgi:hypothetical protein